MDTRIQDSPGRLIVNQGSRNCPTDHPCDGCIELYTAQSCAVRNTARIRPSDHLVGFVDRDVNTVLIITVILIDDSSEERIYASVKAIEVSRGCCNAAARIRNTGEVRRLCDGVVKAG